MEISDGSKYLKNNASQGMINSLAAEIARVYPAFNKSDFQKEAGKNLKALRLKERVIQVAEALNQFMPDFEQADKVLRQALESEDFDGWMIYAVNEYVALAGRSNPDLALPLLGELTSRWSAEFAIRPFIEDDRDRVFKEFDRWVDSDDSHKRRLVSEGSRPRLPWAPQLEEFIDDPTPMLPYLNRLAGDPAKYVRLSVSNHLNDISKDHPEIALETARRWQKEVDSKRIKPVINNSLRTLIKANNFEALKVNGYNPELEVELKGFQVTPERLGIGESVAISFNISSSSGGPVVIFYRIYHAGKKGLRGPKSFLLLKANLEAGEDRFVSKNHRFQQLSTRKIYPGVQKVELVVNGIVQASSEIELE